MAKTKRFMDGGFATPNTYPFANQNIPDSSVKIGARQEPLGNVMDNQPSVTMYKRGGKVKKYAEGGKADYAIPDARARAAMRDVEEEKARKRMGEKYESALTSTAPAPAASSPAKPPVKKAAGGCAKAYAKGGRIKRYEDGGVTEGPNVNVKDDERARAMAAVRRRMAGEDDENPAVAIKPRPEAKLLPTASGRARENVAPSGRGAAAGSFKSEAPAKAKTEVVSKYPTAKERGAQMRQSLEDVEAENVRKRNERAESGKSSLSDVMSGFKRRFGTKAMREEEGMKKGGKVNCYAGGGTVKGAGIAQRGVRKCKVV